MAPYYPRIRVREPDGSVLVREGLSITFYLRRSHTQILDQVRSSLEAYLHAVGPQALGWYLDTEGEGQKLDTAGWTQIWQDLAHPEGAVIRLRDAATECCYRFEYYGKAIEAPPDTSAPGEVCMVSFWLPTEYLEAQGPSGVRELALQLAEPLPFCSGHAGLSFNGELGLMGALSHVAEYCFRYPGIDIPGSSSLSWELGTRVRGPHWLTFLGQPVLTEMGGAEALRARLHSPDTTVRELPGQRVVVALGEWPRAGDTERADTLPAYRELARILEPWLYREAHGGAPELPPGDRLRWERRFLD